MAGWAIQTPQIFLVALGIVFVAIMVIACILCCCRGQCCFCCQKPVQIKPEMATKEELDAMERAKKSIKVKDVLAEEQAHCEDMGALEYEH